MTVYFSSLQELLRAHGVKPGDLLYVASNVTRLLTDAQKHGVRTPAQRDVFLGACVASFQDLVTEQGTLLFPLFTWDFCHGLPFDIRKTPGKVGAFNNWCFTHRKDFQRTQHPIYSFLVWGKKAPDFLAMENHDSFGSDSPFAYLHRHGGKMILFDVCVERSFTFVHYVEECIHAPYRYLKAFRGPYIDAEGRESDRIYTMYVQDLAIQSEKLLYDDFLAEQGALDRVAWNGMTIGIIDLAKAFDVYREDLMKHGGRACYRFTDYAIDWTQPPTHEDDLVR